MAQFDPIHHITPYPRWIDFTPTLPTLYWNVDSHEERIKKICFEIHKLAEYSNYLADNINIDHTTIEEMQQLYEKFESTAFLEEFEPEIQAWVDEHLSTILDNIQTLQENLATETHNREDADADIIEDYELADTNITNNYRAADSQIILDYQAADSAITNAYEAADGILDDKIDAEIENRQLADEALDDRIDATNDRIDETNEELDLVALRASIPDQLHEATPIVRVPVDFVSTTVQTHPQGMTTFGGTPENPTYAALYQYHRVDTVHGANTMGTMEVWRLADHTKVSNYELEFGHGNGVSTDWTNKKLIVAGHSYGTGSNIYNPRMYILDWTESGTLTLYDTIVTPFTMIQSAGVLPSGEYWVWAPYERGIYVSTNPSPNMIDWQQKIPWEQRNMGTGINQSAFYTEELDSFGFVYSNASCIAFADANTGYVWRTMHVDPALGFIDTEELEAAVIVGTRLWLCNSPVFDNNHEGVLNRGAEATIWTVDLPKARNYKDWSSSRAVVRFTYHVDSSQEGLPTKTWTNPGQGGGRVDLNNPRDLIGLEHYPGEKLVYIDTPYPDRVIPLINTGFVILSGVGNANLINGNQCETIGGLYMYGKGTYVTWFGWNTATGIQITPEAVANWSQVYNNCPTWIRMTYFPTLAMRGATATKTATDNSVWIGGEDGILQWPSVSTKTDFMYLLRADLHDTVTAQ